MNKARIFYIIFLLAMLSSPQVMAVNDVSSKDLIEKANFFNSQVVKYRGEGIGAIMRRGDEAWINVSDGSNAIGVWCRNEDLEGVKFLGDYKHKGDIIEITGTFHRACPEHKGELDIHAFDIRTVSSGYIIDEKCGTKRLQMAVGFFVFTIVAIIMLKDKL